MIERGIRGILTLAAFALLLAGCGGRPLGVLIPSEVNVPGTSVVNVLVATTRKPTDQPGMLFSGERGRTLELTGIGVSIPPDGSRAIGQVQWPQRLPPDPRTDFTTVSVKSLDGKGQAKAWLAQNTPKNGRALIFVHGFNNRYEDAVYRFAQIVHDSKAEAAPIVFTWPSRASVFDYVYDKESTNYSRDALEEMLRQAQNQLGIRDITIMAHSMGAWLTVEALRQMAIRDGRIAPKIRNVVLASPDLDVDVFAKQFMALGKNRPKFTIFVSQDDRALSLSRRISGNIDRLGQINPSVEPYRSALEREGITVIDLTAMESGDSLNHGKFAESPEVVRLIGQRIVAGQTITDSDVGLGDRIGAVAMGAAQTVGSAASVVVSAPIAIFDESTRRSYGEQVDRFGRALGNTAGAATGQ